MRGVEAAGGAKLLGAYAPIRRLPKGLAEQGLSSETLEMARGDACAPRNFVCSFLLGNGAQLQRNSLKCQGAISRPAWGAAPGNRADKKSNSAEGATHLLPRMIESLAFGSGSSRGNALLLYLTTFHPVL
jgi:hypothetical protein